MHHHAICRRPQARRHRGTGRGRGSSACSDRASGAQRRRGRPTARKPSSFRGSSTHLDEDVAPEQVAVVLLVHLPCATRRKASRTRQGVLGRAKCTPQPTTCQSWPEMAAPGVLVLKACRPVHASSTAPPPRPRTSRVLLLLDERAPEPQRVHQHRKDGIDHGRGDHGLVDARYLRGGAAGGALVCVRRATLAGGPAPQRAGGLPDRLAAGIAPRSAATWLQRLQGATRDRAVRRTQQEDGQAGACRAPGARTAPVGPPLSVRPRMSMRFCELILAVCVKWILRAGGRWRPAGR